MLDIADTVVFMELARLVWTGPRDEIEQDDVTASDLGATN